jgi:hypothetical protein
MPKPPLINDPAHWRKRAEQARRIADQLDDPLSKKTMLEIAQSYEKLAARAQTRLGPKMRT